MAEESKIAAGRIHAYGALPVPHFTPDLLSLIRTGRVYSLSVIFEEHIPVPVPMVPYTLSPRLRHGDLQSIAPASAAAEVITMAAHTGTHIDALCHIGEYQDSAGRIDPSGSVRLYAGEGRTVDARKTITYQGQTHLSAAEMPPIILRGVLLDIARVKGVSVLPEGYLITPDDIEHTLKTQNTRVTAGTALLIRTGFYQHLMNGHPAYRDNIAGIGLGAAQLLFGSGMILVGSDNISVEAIPPDGHAVHRFLHVHHGVTHVENMYLEDLAIEKQYEFLLILTPLRLKGATGSWVHPIAII